MDLYESYFLYSGVSSEKYNLIFANVETEEETLLYGELDMFNIYNKKNSVNYFTGFDLEDSALTFDAEVVTCNGSVLTKNQIKEIEKWLFCPRDYSHLYSIEEVTETLVATESQTNERSEVLLSGNAVGDASKDIKQLIVGDRLFDQVSLLSSSDVGKFSHTIGDIKITFLLSDVPVGSEVTVKYFTYKNADIIDGERKGTYLNCMFINPSKIEAPDGVVGFKFTVVCDSLMAWQDEVVKEFSPTSTTGNLEVEVDSDIMDYIYPKVSITVGESGGDITLFNASDDASRLTKFINMPANTTVTLSGSTNFVSNNYYGLFSNKNFIRLIDGINSIAYSGDISSISFSFNNRKFL